MDALRRTQIYGLLDLVIWCAVGVDNFGMPQGLIEAKRFRTNGFAVAVGDAFI